MAPVPQPEDKGPHQNPDHNDVDVMDPPDFIIDQNSTDSDDDDVENDGMNGYQMLPQDIDHSDNESENSDLEEQSPVEASGVDRARNDVDRHVEQTLSVPHGLHTAGGSTPSYMQMPDLPPSQSKDLLWNQSHCSGRDISLNPDQSNQIKSTMSKFSLPENSIPEWAREISDEQWKEKLVQLKNKKA